MKNNLPENSLGNNIKTIVGCEINVYFLDFENMKLYCAALNSKLNNK